MPSFDHEILVDLFREDGRLAVELLRRCAGISVEHTRVEHRSIDLSQVAPTEYRADDVLVLFRRDSSATTAVIVEVQLDEDDDKLRTWPVYVAALRARLRCPAMLLVITRDPATARWARRPIELGHPGFQLTPLVVDYADVPRITDLETASHLPQLAVLSVLAHPALKAAEMAIEAISQLPEDLLRLYTDVILKALPAELRRILEARMIKGYQYQSDFARKYYGQGLEEGREEGRQEGRERLQAAVVALARTKLKTVSDDDLARIAAITDLRVLTELVTSLGQAHSAHKARAALDRALNH
ncbi:MAG TPA: hypothetical protein VMS11_11310 [Solirubrobacterales bacterium]|nr:hypothetical protein [Solirubrobacterales bacterium]